MRVNVVFRVCTAGGGHRRFRDGNAFAAFHDELRVGDAGHVVEVDEHSSRGAVEVVEHGEPLVHIGEIGTDFGLGAVHEREFHVVRVGQGYAMSRRSMVTAGLPNATCQLESTVPGDCAFARWVTGGLPSAAPRRVPCGFEVCD